MEARVLRLERLSAAVAGQGCRGVVEDVGAEDGGTARRSGAGAAARRPPHAGVGHLHRIEQGQQACSAATGRAIAREAAGRAFVLDAFRTRAAAGGAMKQRRELQVAQRRHRARARWLHAGAARLHGQAVGRPVGMRRVVAGRAGQLARGGQRTESKKISLAQRAAGLSCAGPPDSAPTSARRGSPVAAAGGRMRGRPPLPAPAARAGSRCDDRQPRKRGTARPKPCLPSSATASRRGSHCLGCKPCPSSPQKRTSTSGRPPPASCWSADRDCRRGVIGLGRLSRLRVGQRRAGASCAR